MRAGVHSRLVPKFLFFFRHTDASPYAATFLLARRYWLLFVVVAYTAPHCHTLLPVVAGLWIRAKVLAVGRGLRVENAGAQRATFLSALRVYAHTDCYVPHKGEQNMIAQSRGNAMPARSQRRYRLLLLVTAALLLLVSGCTFVIEPPAAEAPAAEASATEEPAAEAPAAPSVDDLIANAMSAGPANLAANAAVWDWPTETNPEFTELRAGTNGWTCLPDDPSTPNADDPLCLDADWLEFFAAFIEGRDPNYTGVGLGYMLQGGGAASISDPFATEPPAGQEWMEDGPHLMVVAPIDLSPEMFAVDPMEHTPYIMFEGTPYEHLMIPVELPAEQPADDKIANAMSGGPANLAADAAVWDWPTAANPEFTELRAGTNGWTCLPDDPATPNSNDPYCLDANWLEFLAAYVEGREPNYTGVGLGYMLRGGGAASITDPSATEPPAGQEWMEDGPHLMVVAPFDLSPDVFSVDPMEHEPYIMFEGTPYEHLMIPVELPAAP